MGRWLLAATAALGVVLALGCGGAWQDAWDESLHDQIGQLADRVRGAEDGPGKDAVLGLLDDLDAGIAADRVGVVELAGFQVEVDEALKDGRIDDAEVQALTAKTREITAD